MSDGSMWVRFGGARMAYSYMQGKLKSTVHSVMVQHSLIREGANKQVISSQADSLIKISRIWAD
ncbi:hypothetical protein M8R66_07750, partial [Enterobacter hormaechei]|nr:hypothetical protein [Enterobacter hormaechei]